MMKSLVILGALCFGVVDAGFEKDQVMSLLYHLNQMFRSKHLAQRRMQTVLTVPAGCEDACSGMDCMYQDMTLIYQSGEAANTTDELEAALSVGVDSVAAICHHQSTVTCAQNASACQASIAGTLAPLSGQGLMASAECMCTACPQFGQMLASVNSVLVAVTLLLSGQALDQTRIMEVMTGLCPMSASMQCLSTTAACAEFMASEGGSTLASFNTLLTQCEGAGLPTNYTTSYMYNSTCATTTTTRPQAVLASGAVAIVQLNVLAGLCWLLSIQN